MEDRIIAATPGIFQLLFLLWIGIDNCRLYLGTNRPGYLVLAIIGFALFPLIFSHVTRAWHEKSVRV